jgi:hypothetical protein
MDAEARKQLSSNARLAAIEEGLRVQLDGSLVNEAISPVVEVGVNLIKSVDAWIVDNPQPPNWHADDG